MKRMTTREVAVELGISDQMVHYYERRGDLDVLEPGARRIPTIYDGDSVRSLGLRLRMGSEGRAVRTVCVHRSLERERLALEVSGLVAEACDDVLHALDRRSDLRPILIWPARVEGFDASMIDKFCTRVYLVSVGDPAQRSERAKQYGEWVVADELRELTIHVWDLVDRRHRNAMLRL